MEKTYYKILKAYESKGEFHINFEFSDDLDGFFMASAIVGTTEENAWAGLNDFLGTNSQQIK